MAARTERLKNAHLKPWPSVLTDFCPDPRNTGAITAYLASWDPTAVATLTQLMLARGDHLAVRAMGRVLACAPGLSAGAAAIEARPSMSTPSRAALLLSLRYVARSFASLAASREEGAGAPFDCVSGRAETISTVSGPALHRCKFQ